MLVGGIVTDAVLPSSRNHTFDPGDLIGPSIEVTGVAAAAAGVAIIAIVSAADPKETQ